MNNPNSKSGDLRTSDFSSGHILHSFFLESSALAHASTDKGSSLDIALNQKLDFGIGEEGIVGRKVSVLDEHHVLLGDGIIGWS